MSLLRPSTCVRYSVQRMSAFNTKESKPTWLSAAFDEIKRSQHLNSDLCDILRAFGRDDADAPGPTSLDPDDLDDSADFVDPITYLEERISTELLDEIDCDQASMFGRRFVSVSTLLKEDIYDKSVTSKQLLRLALHRRTMQILSTTDPVLSKRKALRIRALVDFIWSLSLVLELKNSPGNNKHPTLTQLASELGQQSASHEFAPGFYHSTIEGTTSDFGPVHINILRINLITSGCHMKCIDARNKSTDLPTLAKEMGAVAAISGGFFLYSEPDIELPSRRTDPVGLLVSDGEIVGPPVFQRSTIVQKKIEEDGIRPMSLARIGMTGITCLFSWKQEKIDLSPNFIQLKIGLSLGYDEDADIGHAICVHRADSEEAIVEPGQCAFAIVGNKVIQRKISPGCQVKMPIPLAGFVIIFLEETLTSMSCAGRGTKIMYEHDVAITVSYDFPSPLNSIQNAMAGGPLFFSDDDCKSIDLACEDFNRSAPPVTFSQDETHDHNLLPRMGVGIGKCSDTGEEQLICAAIDGRNLDRALGLTLQGTSDLLRSLGCYKAMNLDGGSSKRMVIWDPKHLEHRVVCLSTTEIKANNGGNDNDKSRKSGTDLSRPVHSAILFCSDTFTPSVDQ